MKFPTRALILVVKVKSVKVDFTFNETIVDSGVLMSKVVTTSCHSRARIPVYIVTKV